VFLLLVGVRLRETSWTISWINSPRWKIRTDGYLWYLCLVCMLDFAFRASCTYWYVRSLNITQDISTIYYPRGRACAEISAYALSVDPLTLSAQQKPWHMRYVISYTVDAFIWLRLIISNLF